MVKISWTIIRIVIVLAIFVFLIKTNTLDFTKLKDMVISYWIIPSLFCYLVVILVSILRWDILLKALGIFPGLKSITKLTFVGYAFNMIIPGGVGGDIVKAYYVAKGRTEKRTSAVTTIGVDRLLGLFSMFSTGALSIAFLLLFFPDFIQTTEQNSFFMSLTIIVFCSTAIMVIGLIILFSKFLRQTKPIRWLMFKAPGHLILEKIYSTIFSFRDNKLVLMKTLGLSYISQLAFILSMFLIGLSANESNIQFSHYFFLTPISLILNAIPISPGGMGSGEFLTDWLFRSFGSSNGSEIMVILHLAFIVVSLFGFLVYIQGKNEFSDIESEIKSE